MGQGYFESFIKRSNKSLLQTSVVLIVLVVIVFVLSLNHFYNMLFGPFKVSAADVLKLEAGSGYKGKYVTLSSDAVIDSGVAEYVKFKSGPEHISNTYWLTDLGGGHLMVIKTDAGYVGHNYTGKLVPIEKEVNKMLVYDLKDAGYTLSAVMLDASYEYTFYYLLLAILVFLTALCIRNILQYFKRGKNPLLHPVNKALSQFGDCQSVTGVIEGELKEWHVVIKTFILTHNWCIRQSVFALDLARNADIVRVGKQMVRQKNKITYKVTIDLNNNKTITEIFGESELQLVYKLMDAIREKNPNVKTYEA